MDIAEQMNRLQSDMAFRSYRANVSGHPDDEAQLFCIILECFGTKNITSIRLSEIPAMFQRQFSKPLTTHRKYI